VRAHPQRASWRPNWYRPTAAIDAKALPAELEDLIEDLIAPGFRERLLASYLAHLPLPGKGN
jgi:hypothetical protein